MDNREIEDDDGFVIEKQSLSDLSNLQNGMFQRLPNDGCPCSGTTEMPAVEEAKKSVVPKCCFPLP